MLQALIRHYAPPVIASVLAPLSVSKADAVAYVYNMEVEWYGDCPRIVTVKPASDGSDAWAVETARNYWSVWRDPNGKIYGEC
jgi:hypothetical protein